VGRHWTFVLLFLLAATLDRATKHWAQAALADGQSIEAIGGFLYFTLTYNTGIAFGMLPDSLWLIVPVSVIVIVGAFVIYLRSRGRSPWLTAALGLLIGGATANLYDRVVHGRVTDFIDLHWWPVFNVADSAITVAVLMLVLRGLFAPEAKDDAPAEPARE
jgi:signal peptidase II